MLLPVTLSIGLLSLLSFWGMISHVFELFTNAITNTSASASTNTVVIIAVVAVSVVAHLGLVLFSRYNNNSERKSPAAVALQRKRVNEERSKTYPPFTPNGWYKLCFSDEVKKGQVIEVDALGRLFAVFRGEDGKIGVLNAYCPHLGANMASQGCVVGNTLQCPFHHWTFRPDGKVDCIPYYEGNIPSNANAVSYHFREVYGQVFLWYHSDGADVEPTWELPAVPGIDDGSMVLRGGGQSYRKTINMHIQEWAENGVDFAHFDYVHKKMVMPWFPSVQLKGVEIMHEGRYFMDEEQKHISYFEDKAHLRVLGYDLPFTKATATIHFIGPGGCIQMWFDIPDLGRIVLFETHTPTAPCVMTRDFLWYADKSIPSIIVYYVIGNWYSQAENDVDIWENKIYLDKPVILKTDGPVNKFRRWYSQFYSEGALQRRAAERHAELF